jgi:hypothetical protein
MQPYYRMPEAQSRRANDDLVQGLSGRGRRAAAGGSV